MTPRRTAAVLWGAVGVLVFLVGHQAYLLLDGVFFGLGPVAGVAVAVFATTGAAAYHVEGRLEAPGAARAEDDSE